MFLKIQKQLNKKITQRQDFKVKGFAATEKWYIKPNSRKEKGQLKVKIEL